MFSEDKVLFLKKFDPEMAKLLEEEEKHQHDTIDLIASENVASPLAVCLEGSVFTNKNIEGYPGKRYGNGTEIEDQVEKLAIERLKQLFGCEYANLQSGNASIANTAVYLGLLEPGDTVLSMGLSDGGHLSHGAGFHFSGRFYNIVSYGVRRDDERIDMEQVQELALKHRPKIVVCGSSSYSRLIDYKAFRKIADSVGAYLWVDAAHVIGLIAGKAIPSPVPYADVVTFSTQKTLRGPRGCGVILCRGSLKDKIDRGVFPSIQGGGKGDMIAARAVLFKECMTEKYRAYQYQVIKNAKALCEGCLETGLDIVSGGTDNHMFVVRVTDLMDSGRTAEKLLKELGIIVSRNLVPFDTQNASKTGGIRLGSPLMTTRGAKEEEMKIIGNLVAEALIHKDDDNVLQDITKKVRKITSSYSLFSNEWLETL